MKISYLLDTDWVIHYLNGHKEIVKKLTSLREEGLAISVTLNIIWHYLILGERGINIKRYKYKEV